MPIIILGPVKIRESRFSKIESAKVGSSTAPKQSEDESGPSGVSGVVSGHEDGEAVSELGNEGEEVIEAGSGVATDTQCVTAANSAETVESSLVIDLSQNLFSTQGSDDWQLVSRIGKGKRGASDLSDSDDSGRGRLVINESPVKSTK